MRRAIAGLNGGRQRWSAGIALLLTIALADCGGDRRKYPDTGIADSGIVWCQDPEDAALSSFEVAEEAPDGSSGCPPTSCDDGNPCTKDTLDPTCVCLHTPTSEIVSCDDGDPCTDQDRCAAGVCRGTPRTESVVLGTLRSFGAAPELETVVGFPTPDRAVFLTGNWLTLLKIDGDRMEVLDRLKWGSSPGAFQISPTVWVMRPSTFILPLAGKRAAVMGADWSIDVFDISLDRLTVLYRYGFGSGGQQMFTAATTQGNSIWTCSGNSVWRYWLDDVQGRITRDPPFRLPTSHSCYALAASPDGKTLLAAGYGGLDIVDVSRGDGSGTTQDTVLPGSFLVDVTSDQRTIGVFRLDGQISGVGTIIVLDASYHTQLTAFAPDDTTTPVGLTMLPSGLLIEEEWAQLPCRQVDANVYSFAAGSATLIGNYVPMSACRAHFGLPPAVLASAGPLVDLPPLHQVMRVDPTTGAMTFLRGREQGAFERVVAAGPNLIEVHGPTSMHLVDISNPTAPVVREGGLLTPMTSDWLRVELSDKGQASVLTVPQSDLSRTGPRTSLYWQRPGALPMVAGAIANDEPDAQWTAAGPYLYSVSVVGSTDFRLRRFPVSSLTKAEDQTASPDLEQIVPSAAPEAFDRRQGEITAVDAASGDVVVAEVRLGPSTSASILSWYSLEGKGYHAVGERAPDDDHVLDLGIFGVRALLLFDNRAVLVDKSGATLATYVHESGALSRLLSFDQDNIYLAASAQDQDLRLGNVVVVLRASDLSLAGRYTLPEQVLSTAAVGNLRVFGMQSALAVATPLCPAR